MKILVVEDEIDLLNAISRGLRASGYAVDKCDDGEKALDLIRVNEYDLVILDLNLPTMDGTEVLEKLREEKNSTKVLILSARASIEDRVKGLDLGADDYLIKPFHFDELEARIRTLIRRKFVIEDNIINHGEVSIDISSRCAYVSNKKLNLTQKEFALLEYLILNKGRIISQENLIEHVWDSSVDIFSNAIRVHINGLRKKLKEYVDGDIIKTIKGIGYTIENEGE